MKTTKTLLLTALALAGLATAACDPEADNVISCEAGTLRLEGTIDGQTIMTSNVSNTGGYAQGDDGGDFGSQNNTPFPDPAAPDVRIQWKKGIAVGQSTDATGTVLMPTGGPLAGQTICAGDESIVRSAEGGELQWVLRNIKGGAGCVQAYEGELKGCFK